MNKIPSTVLATGSRGFSAGDTSQLRFLPALALLLSLPQPLQRQKAENSVGCGPSRIHFEAASATPTDDSGDRKQATRYYENELTIDPDFRSAKRRSVIGRWPCER